jgi:tryptophan halogenase
MSDRAIRKIVIVGGGTAGWMTAAPLAQLLMLSRQQPPSEIVLIESPEIGSIGVGEATLPTIRQYNQMLGIVEADFIAKTQASFKLGIAFKDWGHIGNDFFHGFGDFGPAIEGRQPYLHWLRLRQSSDIPSYEEWSTATVMARANRFVPPQGERPSAANAYAYAYHFDAGLYAAYLRDYATPLGVQRIAATIVEVELRPDDGFVAAVKLADGRRIDGDLFIDCSGQRGLLIAGAMQVGFEDWSAMLPCNSALALPSASTSPLTPYTTSTAQSNGWTWRIPLQHRTGNGHVYCSDYCSDDEAAQVLLAGLDGKALDTPRQLRFTTGRRHKSWVKNVVAIGLSAGFLEPLESTSIHMILDNVGRLIHFFPDRDCRPELADEFNRLSDIQLEAVRDFIILHYKLNQRSDSEFWRYCANMAIPERLQQQIALFSSSAHISLSDPKGFLEPSWVSLYLGLGLRPQSYDPFVDRIDAAALLTHFSRLRSAIAQTVASMPSHADYIARLGSNKGQNT